jgi:hypothetical protein
MKLLQTLLQEAENKQAKKADEVCADEKMISKLASAAIKDLKANNDDVSDMPMAKVTQSVRSCVDGCLIDDDIKLSKDGLEKVVKCVLDEIKSKHKEELFEGGEEVDEAYKPTGKPRGRPRKNADEKPVAKKSSKPNDEDDEDDDSKKVSTKSLAKSLERDEDEDEDDDVKRAADAEKDDAKKIVDTSVKADDLKAAHKALPAKMSQALDMLEVKSAMAARNEMRKMFPKITDEQLSAVATIWKYENK